MEIQESVKTCFTKYAEFKGRASKSEYWWFQLAVFLFNIALLILQLESLSNIFILAIILPIYAAAIRRMHDIGKSGWYILIPIMNIIYLCQDSQKSKNQYGPVPNK